jgi:hypothetical protein
VATSLSRLGSTAGDYERIGIKPDEVLPWEDGARTDGSAGTYEWWYFDARLDDGTKLVVVFFTKNSTYRVGGQAHAASGVGYHDHNWGNAPMNSLINHWYWARGQAGPYTVVASYITAEEKYGNTALPVFLLAENGEIVADDATKVTFEELGTYTDTNTGKPVANVTRYTYTNGDETYVVTFTRHRDLAVNKLIDELQGAKKVAARLIRFDGAYLRFTGELRIEHRHAGSVVDSYSDSAIWELMYLGRTRTKS